jgi:DNA invertase Pin-like site-specific DNA recombinase
MPTTDSDLIPVVGYARASKDKAKDEHTVRDQQTVNEQTAKRLGCRIVARFADNDKSAAKDGVYRDDFEEMLKVLRAGKLADGTPVMGCIVVADDRLIRRTGDYERFVDAITYEEGRVYADARGFKDLYSEDVESMGLMGAVISRMEVKKTRRRLRQWHRTRAEKGITPGGPRPFGWQEDKVTPDPVESELIRSAVEAIIAGRSMHSIVVEWQQKGVKTPLGNNWQLGTFKKMIRSPRLCGWRVINGELVRDGDDTPVVGQWQRIITPEQWQAIQALFEQRRGRMVNGEGTILGALPQDYREHRYLLSGILRCGRILEDGSMCGSKLRVYKNNSTGQRYYGCPAKTLGGCGGVGRQLGKVDEFVSEAVLAKLDERAATARQDVAPWARQRELDEKVEQLKELRVRFAKRSISNTLFFEEVERLEPEIAELRAERERYSLAVEQSAQDLTGIRRRWYSETDEDHLATSQKRTYIRQALHAVIVHPQGKGHGRKFDPDLLEPIWREG